VRFIFLLASCIISLSACTVKDGDSAFLDFSFVQIQAQSAVCEDTASCTSFEVTYPIFKKLNEEVNAVIVQKINDALGYDNPDVAGLPIQEKANRFVKDFEKFQKEFPENEISWYFQSNVAVLLAVDTLVSLAVNSEYYTGGAHGGFSTYYVNVDPTSGKTVTLESVLKPGFEEALRIAGEQSFRDVRVLSDTASFADNGFEFKDDRFALNQNYGFRPEGIVYFYNAYEVAPYVLGPTEIIIPYEAIRDWLR
jgi:hypothetical protein